MVNCFLCNEKPSPLVPLLRCGHYLCCRCYCNTKSNGIGQCLQCKKKLVRGMRINKAEPEEPKPQKRRIRRCKDTIDRFLEAYLNSS